MLISGFVEEIRFALRRLRKAPAFTITALLTLALGIGASTAMFTVVDSILLKPLAYRNSGQLVVAWERVKFLDNIAPYMGPNPRHEAMWAQRTNAFTGLTLVGEATDGVSIGSGHPRVVGTVRAYPNLLDVLGVTPILGRGFRPEDGTPGHDHIALLTYGLWQSLFNGDPNVIGRTVHVAAVSEEIVGVLPQSFHFPKRDVLSAFPTGQKSYTGVSETELLMPAVIDLKDVSWLGGDYGNWIALGRLKPGVSIQRAESELNTIEDELVREAPASERPRDPHGALATYVQPMQEAMVGDSRRSLWLLMAAVITLMLIACVNLANAQLGRAVLRENEAAVHSALGASNLRLLWTSLAESLILAVVGGAAGILLASDALSAFLRYAPIDLPRMREIHLNMSVLLFAALLIMGSGVLFGLLPALKLLRTEPQQALQRNTARAQGTRRRRELRAWFIGLQVFGCTALLLVTGLFAKSLLNLLTSDKGFQPGHVVIAQANLSGKAYAKNQPRLVFDDAVLHNLRTLPGVRSAGLVSAMPLEGETWIDCLCRVDRPEGNHPLANLRWVSPGYFQTIREPLVAGRLFDDRDRNLESALISQSAARAGWPGENPIGRQLKHNEFTYTVIGVVADARNNSLKLAPANMVYLPYKDFPPHATFFMVRTLLPADSLISSIRQASWKYDPGVTIERVKTLDSQIADSLAPERFETTLLTAFGIAALCLAMLGVYGVLSYVVAGRKREIGVRMALGASPRAIYGLTMGEAAIPVLIGLLSGFLASIAAGRIIEKLLYGVGAVDISTTVIVGALFLFAATAAAFLPARRAAGVDPMEALRSE